MRFISTRGQCTPVELSDALSAGLAPDGGLFVPEQFPSLPIPAFDQAATMVEVGQILLQPFFVDSLLTESLPEILTEALNFEIPVCTTPIEGLKVLELFHGPTAAFKDVGARFLAGCLSRLPESQRSGLTVLVATSGDTGGAVAAAFEGRTVQVGILYPRDRVSPRQEHQLSCWNEPIASLRIAGTFDDCQRLVKSAFVDPELSSGLRLTSANSISIGRLLPQMVYHAHSALIHFRESGQRANFIIPTGNLGNALACIWARHIGLPIGRIVLATNENRVIARYLETSHWRPEQTVSTLASAMDVGNPSNMERLRHLVSSPEALSLDVEACPASDDEIRDTIHWAWQELGRPVCPHTATALKAWRGLRENRGVAPWIVVSTAHAAKFDTVVEPLIGQTVSVPKALQELLDRPRCQSDLGADLDGLRIALFDRFSRR